MARHQARRGGVNVVLIGAGGHAKAISEAIEAAGGAIAAYVAPEPAEWLSARHVARDDEVDPALGRIVLGIGGVEPAQLRRRLELLDGYLARGFEAMTVIHQAAHVSPAARVEPGAVVLAGAVVQPGARVGRGAIVNSQALVEHDSEIGAGTHIAPGAVVLGGCRIGSCCMIGARAVVLQNASLADGTLVRAATRHSERS